MQDDEWARSGHGWATENLTGNPLPFNQSDCGTGPSEIERHCLLDMGLTAKDVRDVTLGWRKTTAMAMRAVHAAGGWVWQMFTERRAATTGDECAKAYRGACTAGSKDQTHMCSYSLTLSDRHSPGSLTDPEGDVAKFLVQRGPYGFLGTAWVGCVGEGKSRHSNETYVRAAAFDRDYGTPLGLCKEVSEGVFRREFSKATASHDCNTGKSSIAIKTDEEISTNAFLLRWPSRVTDPSSSVFAFTLTVQEADGADQDKPGAWETGLVFRENTTVSGVSACCGNASWALRPQTKYTWRVEEFTRPPGQPSAPLKQLGAQTGSFATSAALPSPRDEARAAAFAPAVSRVFDDTRDSIRDRVKSDGFFGESPFAHEYGALEFIRTIGAAAAAFLEMGDDAIVAKLLRLVLKLHVDAGSLYPRHTINPAGNYSANGTRPYTLEAGNEQVDGSFHLIVAWARYCALNPEDEAMFAHYQLLKNWTLRYSVPIDPSTPPSATAPQFFNSSLGLIFNPNLEHSRDGHYWPAYDLIANVFAEEALRLMISAAERAQDSDGARRFRTFRAKLQSGLRRSLSKDVDGAGSIYAELRPRGPGGILPDDPSTPDEFVWGMSWVNLAPIPAYAAAFSARNESHATALDSSKMGATLTAYRRLGFFVWEPATGDNRTGAEIALTHLNASTHGRPFYKKEPAGGNLQVQKAAIGKGFGWELLWAAHSGDWQRVVAMQRYLGQWTYAARYTADGPLKSYFGESYWFDRYRASPAANSYESDPGNGEQVCWYVWAQHVVRRLVGSTLKSDDICSATAHVGCGGGHDLVGLRSAPKVHTAAACCAICKRTPNCTAWTWNGPGGNLMC